MKTASVFPTSSLLALAVLAALAGPACLAEIGDEQSVEDLAQEISPIFHESFWTDVPGFPTPTRANGALGMAIGLRGTYTWYTDGKVGRGSNLVTCADGFWDYSAPDSNDWKAIRAVAFDPIADRVYTWYADARHTVGVPTNLRSISDKKAFLLSPRPGAGTFTMDDLVDAYCTNNLVFGVPRCVYYWRNGTDPVTSPIYRTEGTPGNSVAHSLPKQVTTTRDHGRIVGIDFNPANSRVYTWYSNGRLNISSSSLNLAQ